MEVSSSQQLNVFVVYIITGAFCGLLFDVLRSIRKIHITGTFLTAVEDIIFFLLSLCAILSVGYKFDDGKIRYYQVLGILFGALVYYLTLSRIFIKIISFIGVIIYKYLIKNILRIINLIKKICFFLYKKIAVRVLWVKKQVKSKKVMIKRLKKRLKML